MNLYEYKLSQVKYEHLLKRADYIPLGIKDRATAIKKYHSLCKEIRDKRIARLNKPVNIHIRDSAFDRYKERIMYAVKASVGFYPSNYDIDCIYADVKELEVSVTSRATNRGSWASKHYTLHIKIPYRGCPMDLSDNIMLFDVKYKQLGKGKIGKGTFFVKGRGYEEIRKEKMYVYIERYQDSRDYIFYTVSAHGKTIKEALRAYKRKMKTRYSVQDANLTLDTVMTFKKYHKITGACTAGTKAFCDKHGISYDAKMKLRDLLPLLAKDNAYGYGTILAKIKKDVVNG